MSVPSSTVRIQPADDPYQEYLAAIAERNTSDDDLLLIVPFTYKRYWLDDEPVELIAVYRFVSEHVLFTTVELQYDSLSYWETSSNLDSWLADHDASLFTLGDPLPLHTIGIPKPWGQEIWYTGVERRGVACFGDSNNRTPIPYLLAAMPSLLGERTKQDLILLKILDPVPEEVFGDLYFELHQQKQEVYIVTNIDRQAWPEGVGQMRMGFNPDKLQELSNETEFRSSFLKQVQAYRNVRQQIDQSLDEQRTKHGYELNAEVSVERLKEWLSEIPEYLSSEELQLREQMETYFGSLPLSPGDVVKVPLRVPHSLQHGVRTIEFQTPVYERYIIAFAQKVLTQSHWDTEAAVEEMEVVAPSLPPLPLLSDSDGHRVEQVVDFDDFSVQRHTLGANCDYQLLSPNMYQLLIAIEGTLMVGPRQLTAEQAVLLPVSPTGVSIWSGEQRPAIFLVAQPK